jgi:anti-sigma factor RsiW
MLTCRQVQNLHHQFIDGALSASLVAEVHAHLLQCPACQREVEISRAAAHVLAKDFPEPSLDSGFASRVVAAMAEKRPARTLPIKHRREQSSRWRRFAMVGSLPAAAAVVFLAILIWPSGDKSTRDTKVAGAATSVVDAVGVKDIADPTLEAVAGARDAAQSLNQLLQISANEARQSMQDGLREIDSAAPRSEPPSLMELFFQPFDEVLRPEKPATAKDGEKKVIRF